MILHIPGAKSSFGPIWKGKGPKTLKNFIGLLPAVALNRSKAQTKDIRKLINNMSKIFSRNTYFMSNLYAEKCHFIGKSVWDQPRNFDLLSFTGLRVVPSRNFPRTWTWVWMRDGDENM